MVKNNNLYRYILTAGRAIFTFAVTSPYSPSNAHDWIMTLFLAFLFNFLIVLILFKPGRLKPLASFFCLVYILYLLARHAYLMCMYMKTYHGDTSMVSIVILTAITVLFLNISDRQKIAKIAGPMFSLVLIMIILILFINFKLFNPMNLYNKKMLSNIEPECITMFDFILPLYICVCGNKRLKKENAGAFIITLFLTLIMLTSFIFGCLGGDYLYSLSPLQIIIRISRTGMIKSYDAIYNVLLCFAYFSSVALITDAYKAIKKEFRYFSSADLLLSLGLLFVMPVINNIYNLILLVIVVVIILFGREKVNNENI